MIQQVNDSWIYMDRATQIWHKNISVAQGVYQPIHWVALARMQAELRLAPNEGMVADIGCGHGIVTVNLAWKKPRTHVVGIDPDEEKMAVGQHLVKEHQVHNCTFKKATLEEPGLPAGSCTGVICGSTLDHLPDVKPALKEKVERLMGLLRRGGRLIVSFLDVTRLEETTVALPPTPLALEDFDFLPNKTLERNCPRWWHLFYVDKR